MTRPATARNEKDWQLRRKPLPPTPSPERRGGARHKALFPSPSPLRGGGWGEGFRQSTASHETPPAFAMISTRDLSGLPDVDGLKRLLQSMAMLDAILSPEWQYRYYSFNSKWSRGEQMGSMRDGCGDDFFALFNKHGCFLKGFDHEAMMSPYGQKPKRVWPGVLDAVPEEFADELKQPAFSMEDTTFCIWRRYSDSGWQRGIIDFPTERPDPDGSQSLLSPLDGKP